MSSRLDGHAVHLLAALQSEPNVSHVVSTRQEPGVATRFTYILHCKASRKSAMSSRLDWRRVRSCGSLTRCIAKRAERQQCRLDSTGGGCSHAVHLLPALQSEPNVSHVISTRLKAGAVMRFTYILHCKGSRTSAMSSRLDWRRVRSCGSLTSCIAKRAERQPCRLASTGGGDGHAVHLLSALQSEPNVSHVVSTQRSSGSLTGCIAKGAERQPCRLDSTGAGCGHAVHLLPALQNEPNVNRVISPRLEAGAVMRFTYFLLCKACRTSAMSSRFDWRRVRSCGSHTVCIAKRAERQPCDLDSNGGGCGHAVHLPSALQREPNVSHVVSTRLQAGAVMRFTYSLHCNASRTSTVLSHLDWRRVRSCGSLTICIAKRAERQACRLDSMVMRFTYILHCKGSRTSAMSSRLDLRRVRSCGSLTPCIAKRAERQPCCLTSTGGECGHAVHLLSALQSEPNVSDVVSTRLSCGSFTGCIAKRAERQPCPVDSTGGGCSHAVHLQSSLQSEPKVSHVVSTRLEAGAVMRFTYSLRCKESRMSAMSSRLDGHAVHLLAALQWEPNVSHVVSTRLEACAVMRFTYSLHCKASRTSAMSSRLVVMRFTYTLHCNESRTSAMSSRLDWRRVWSCGSLTRCIAKRAERQPCCLTSTGGGCGHAVHLLSALQSERNVSHVVSTQRSSSSLTGCIAKGAERQPCRLDSTGGGCGHAVHLLAVLQCEPNVSNVVSTRLEAGAATRFTYILHCKGSRKSAMSSRLDWRRVWSCGSLTGCIAKRAERQPCRLDSTGGGCGHAVLLLPVLQSEPNVSNVVSTRLEAGAATRFTYILHCKASRKSAMSSRLDWRRVRSCGSLTACIAKRAERQPCRLDSMVMRFTYSLHCEGSRTSALSSRLDWRRVRSCC